MYKTKTFTGEGWSNSPKILQSHVCCSDSVVLKHYSKGLNKAPFAPMKLTESDMKKHPDVTTTLRG